MNELYRFFFFFAIDEKVRNYYSTNIEVKK